MKTIREKLLGPGSQLFSKRLRKKFKFYAMVLSLCSALLVTAFATIFNTTNPTQPTATQTLIDIVANNDSLTGAYNPQNDVEFYFYSRQNQYQPQVLKFNDAASIQNSNFDSNKNKTIVLTHGWLYNYTLFFCQEGKDRFLALGDYNIIIVDWSKGGSDPNYLFPRYRVQPTGKFIATFINFLIANTQNLSLSNFILAGFSLGAHVLGVTGKELGGQVALSVAVDPAGPLFTPDDPDCVSKNDANLVIVLHSNGGFQGLAAPVGHVDFYANGGLTQPGCNSLTDIINSNDLTGGCSHDRGAELFLYSLNCTAINCFIGVPCNPGLKIIILGIHLCNEGTPKRNLSDDSAGTGIYYFFTSSNPPYGLGVNGAKCN